MALRNLRIEKLLSDEIQKETSEYHAQIAEPDFEGDEEHKRKLENQKKD